MYQVKEVTREIKGYGHHFVFQHFNLRAVCTLNLLVAEIQQGDAGHDSADERGLVWEPRIYKMMNISASKV